MKWTWFRGAKPLVAKSTSPNRAAAKRGSSKAVVQHDALSRTTAILRIQAVVRGFLWRKELAVITRAMIGAQFGACPSPPPRWSQASSVDFIDAVRRTPLEEQE